MAENSATPNLHMYKFTSELESECVSFEVLKLEDSVFIWIGNNGRSFVDLSIALQVNQNEVMSSRIIGSVHTKTPSDLMAQRLSLKLKKMVYLGYNLLKDNLILLKAVEKRIQQEIESNPDEF